MTTTTTDFADLPLRLGPVRTTPRATPAQVGRSRWEDREPTEATYTPEAAAILAQIRREEQLKTSLASAASLPSPAVTITPPGSVTAPVIEPKDAKLRSRIEVPQFELPFEGTKEFALAQIKVDPSIQMRAQIDATVVGEYAESMSSGIDFPPVIVFAEDGTYRLADGFHRVEAAKLAGLENIVVEVKSGGRLEALRYALGANVRHGLRRTNADKRRAVEIALKEFAGLSDRAIADLCGVGNALVSELRKQVCDSNTSSSRKGRDGKSYPSGKCPNLDDRTEPVSDVKGHTENKVHPPIAATALPPGGEAVFPAGEPETLPDESEPVERTALSGTATARQSDETAFQLADGRDVTVNRAGEGAFLSADRARHLLRLISDLQPKGKNQVIVARQQHLTLTIIQALNEHAQVFPTLTRGQIRQDLDHATNLLRKIALRRISPELIKKDFTETTEVALATDRGSA